MSNNDVSVLIVMGLYETALMVDSKKMINFYPISRSVQGAARTIVDYDRQKDE